MARRKIVVAMMMHETTTFSPVPTPLASFGALAGVAAIEEFRDTNTQLGGFLGVAQKAGTEIVVPVAGGAHPSGYVEKSAYEDMAEAIVGAVRGGCDAAFLALHGAMVAEHTDDGEGELLRRVRAVAPRLPIAVGLDFHAHMTSRMIDNATVITGYRTYPHVDIAWWRREAFLYRGAPLAGQIAHGRTLAEGPVVLVDHGDNAASGGTQDVMSVIAEVIRQGLDDVVAGPICDSTSVARILDAGTAASVTLPVGGKIDMPQINLPRAPLTLTSRATRSTDGQFTVGRRRLCPFETAGAPVAGWPAGREGDEAACPHRRRRPRPGRRASDR